MKKVLNGLVFLVLSAALVFVVFKNQAIADWWTLRDYTPSAEVVALADKTDMTKKARNIFYVYNPRVEESSVFNQDCTKGESTIILGCYDGKGIYVYDVTDPRLSGIEEVTAAHEMLHAAYDRLSDRERAKVNILTEKTLAGISNERIQKLIKGYQDRNAATVPNELHSILATEIATLEPELETYYAQYFQDRSKVVKLSEGYEQVFTSLKSDVERYDAELALIKAQTIQSESSLSIRAEQLKADKTRLDIFFDTKDFKQYNQLVPGYNAGVTAYNNDLDVYKELIANYNDIVGKRNALTVEQNKLIKSLDSKAQEL